MRINVFTAEPQRSQRNYFFSAERAEKENPYRFANLYTPLPESQFLTIIKNKARLQINDKK